MATKKLEVRFTGNNRQLASAISDTDGRMGRLGSSMGRTAGVIAGAVGAAFAIDKIADFGTRLFDLGQQMEVAGIKADTVFEGQAGVVREWADSVNESMGISDEQVVGLAANFGDLLKPMGFTSEQAADMSQEVIGLSGALSAWSGGTRSAAEVSDILSSAMLGEREQLKELGINISEADVQARLAAKGQAELTGAARDQAEAIATQELIFEKSADAQEAWADGSMDGTKATNELKAAWADAQVMLAEKLLPAVQTAFRWISDNVLPIVRDVQAAFEEGGLSGAIGMLGDRFAQAWPQIQSALGTIVTNIGNWIVTQGPIIAQKLVGWGAALAEWVLPQVPPLLQKLGTLLGEIGRWIFEVGLPELHHQLTTNWGPAFMTWLGDNYGPYLAQMGTLLAKLGAWIVTEAAPFLISKLVTWSMALLEWVHRDVIPAIPPKLWELATAIGNWITNDAVPWLIIKAIELGDALTGWLSDIPGEISNLAAGMWDGIPDAFRSAINVLIDMWNGLEFGIPGFDPPGPGSFPGFTLGTPNIARLADGGIVRHRPGGIIANIGEGRHDEAVVPLDGRSGLGGTVINLNVNAGMGTDGPAVGRQIARELESFFRSGGRLAGVA